MQREMISQLKRHEGLRLNPYKCTADKLTIGYGRNLDGAGITEDEAELLLFNDIQKATDQIRANYSFYSQLSDPRKAVLINMVFNLGLKGFSGFRRFIAALESRDYELAAKEMTDSRWALQTGTRALELANQMQFGEWP